MAPKKENKPVEDDESDDDDELDDDEDDSEEDESDDEVLYSFDIAWGSYMLNDLDWLDVCLELWYWSEWGILILYHHSNKL